MSDELRAACASLIAELAGLPPEHAEAALQWVLHGVTQALAWAARVEPGQYLLHHADVVRGVAWHPYVIARLRGALAARELALVDDGQGLVVRRADS